MIEVDIMVTVTVDAQMTLRKLVKCGVEDLPTGSIVHVKGLLHEGDGFRGFYETLSMYCYPSDRIDGASVVELNDGRQAALLSCVEDLPLRAKS